MIQIVDHPIDECEVLTSIKSNKAGACVLFSGTTRQFTGDQETETLWYESYREMAEKQMQQLQFEAHEKWPLVKSAIVHRLGEVPVGQTSVVVAVSSPHRSDAFAAAQWIMDTLKRDVPIWKRESWANGDSGWIHPNSGNISTDENKST